MTDVASIRYNSLTQTFRVTTPVGVPGIYVSKLGLYFRKKSDSLGVQVYLIRLTNGFPDLDKVIRGSMVTVDAEDVNISTDGSTETQFVFPQLVYLEADQSYGFCVQPIASSPDYELWVGELGRRDLANDKPIGSNPLVETAYYSGNAERYADLVNQDIKFILYRARFTAATGTAAIRNKNIDILDFYNFSPVTGRPDIRAGDQVYGFANGYANSQISGTVLKLDTVNKLLYIANSSGNFTPNTDIAFVRTGEEGKPFIDDSGFLGLARINSSANNGLYKFPYHAIVPKFGIGKVPATDVALTMKGAVYNGTKYVQDTTRVLQNNIELEFNDNTRYFLGETEEKSSSNDFRTGTTPSGKACSNSTLVVEATLSSDSNFVSPVIDLAKNSMILIKNRVNANTTNEHTRLGGADAKYISKIITLEDGMEAEDLKLYITANKPANTEIYVYTKIWNASDPQLFDDKVWSKMVIESSEAARNTNDPDEYLEYVYSFATTPTLAGNAFAAYQTNNTTPVVYYAANSTGGITNGPFYGGAGQDKVIKKFCVKLVLTSDSGKEYLYPKINDLRVIALQV